MTEERGWPLGLSPEQIRELEPEQLEAMWAKPVQKLRPEQLQALRPEQIWSLKEWQLAALSPDQIDMLEQIAKRRPQQIEERGVAESSARNELESVRTEISRLQEKIPPKWVSALLLPVVGILGAILIGMMAYQQVTFSWSISGLRDDISDLGDDMRGVERELSGLRAETRDGLWGLRVDMQGVKTEIQGLRVDMQGLLKMIEKNQEAIQTNQRAIAGMMQRP
jgi:hypothetical protein